MQNYIAEDEISKEILNSAKLLKEVNINALILGFTGVGKKTLANFILPNAKIYDAKTLQDDILSHSVQLNDNSVIISKIENLTNIDLFINWVKENNTRVIALSNQVILNQYLQELFSITLEIPILNSRPKDTKALTRKFSKEASSTLEIETLEDSKLLINISNNTHSLRKSIYFSYLLQSIGENEILDFLETYFSTCLEKGKTYKELLHIFEAPLLKAASKKYSSQVKMAKFLDLNRITLRKKLETNKDFL